MGGVLNSVSLQAVLLEYRCTALQQAVLILGQGEAVTALSVMQMFGLMAAGCVNYTVSCVICAGLAATKSMQSFCEFTPMCAFPLTEWLSRANCC